MRRISYLPWDIRSWEQALKQAGIPGLAMMLLALANTLALPHQTTTVHESTVDLLLFRLPLGAMAAMLVFWKPRFNKIRIRDLRFWYLLYLMVYWASVSWSYSPVATAGKALELTVGFFIAVEATSGPRSLVRLEAMVRLLVLILSSLALLTVLAYFTGLPEFVKDKPGFFTHTVAQSSTLDTDTLGYLSVSLMLTSAAEYYSGNISRRKFLGEFAYGIFLFAFSSSRLSLVIVVLGITFILWRRSKATALTFLVGTVGGAVIFSGKLMRYLSFGQDMSTVDTLSGRTIMWLAAVTEWRKRPWFGYGGGVGGKWVIEHLGNKYLANMSHLHNGFLECLTGVGVIGFFFGLMVFILAIKRTLRLHRRYPNHSWLFIWMVSFALMSTVGPGVFAWMTTFMAMYLIYISFLDILDHQDKDWVAKRAFERVESEVQV